MTYQDCIKYLFNSTPVFERIGAPAYKEGLKNTLVLDEHFGHPHTFYRTIHIAGTNGKGSCAHSFAAILQQAGYRVGLYTSPHLVDFRERIRVNGLPISKERVIRFVNEERNFFEPLHPSFFEITTALAFLYFKEQKVDIAVVEVGLGGRLDCTNIIKPEISVITNISYDHTQFLGDTLEKIAGEKAGIIKQGVPVVIGEAIPQTRTVFEQKAEQLHAPITFAEDNQEIICSSRNIHGGRDYTTKDFGVFHGELGGDYQTRNTNTILCALKVLDDKKISKEDIQKGLNSVCKLTGLSGRWQIVRHNPLVICDTGHNVGGWNWLAQQIKDQPCDKLRIVFGMVNDKDISSVLSLLPRKAFYYWAQASCKRAFSSDTVAKIGKEHSLVGKDCGSVANAYATALSEASPNDFIFVGGSSYIVADFLTLKHF